MDNFEKGLFSPSKSNANSKSFFIGGNNENDSCQDMMGPKSQNHKKVVVKRFMSPTISAASKAAASKAAPSRKKILVDRNENLITSFDKNHSKKGNGDFDSSRSMVFSPNSHHNEPTPDGEMENKATVNGSSVNAYDPSNNYLSPRPRFLRFNPNKRREIFNRLDREGCGVLEKGSSGSLERRDQEDSSEEAGKISKVSPLKENNVESNYTNGGEDDVDDDDSNDDDDDDVDCYDEDEYEEELEKDKGGRCFRGIIKILLTTLACLLSVSYICSMNSPSSSVSSNGMWNLSNGYAAMIKEQSFEPINIYGHDFLANQQEYDFGGAECAEFEEDDDGEIEESFDPEMPEDEVSDVYGNYEEVASDAHIEVTDTVEKDVGIEDVRSSDNSQLKEEPDESMDFNRSSLEKQAEDPYIVLHDEALNQTKAEDSKVMDHHETYEELNVGSTEDLTEPGHETDGSLMQKTKGDSTLTIIGLSLISMILAPLALFHYSKKKKIARAKEPRSRSHTEKQQHNFMSEDKATNPAEKKVEFLARSMQHNTLMKESYETIKDDINAPSVELLGEIVIGQVNNLRICSEAYKINELKEANTDTFFTNQVSLVQSDSTPTQPFSRVHSTGTESKSLRSKVGDAEEAMAEVTPLRRSARLRNRISP